MAEKQHAEVLEPAPYLTPSWLGTLVGWGRLVKTPRRLVRGVRRHGKRLWLSRRVRRAWWALRMRDNQNVCSVEINAQFGFFAQVSETLHLWRDRQRQRRELAQWTDRDLHDVGLSWSDIVHEAEKPFWRA